MPVKSSEIEALAEDSIRETDGDWRAAGVHFRSELESRPQLKEELWDRIVAQELRAAAHRLGATTRPCPNCGEDIPVDASVCRFCGRDIDEKRPTSLPQNPPLLSGGGPMIRNFTLLTGWVLIVLIIILIVAFTRG